jgi:hypothetical protein
MKNFYFDYREFEIFISEKLSLKSMRTASSFEIIKVHSLLCHFIELSNSRAFTKQKSQIINILINYPHGIEKEILVLLAYPNLELLSICGQKSAFERTQKTLQRIREDFKNYSFALDYSKAKKSYFFYHRFFENAVTQLKPYGISKEVPQEIL